jgi:hypothetical protein
MLVNSVNHNTPILKEAYQPDQNKAEDPRNNHSEVNTPIVLGKENISKKRSPIRMPLLPIRQRPFLLLLLISSISRMKTFEKSTKAVRPLKDNMKEAVETENNKTDIDEMKKVEATALKKNFTEMKVVEVTLHEIGSNQRSL